MQQWFSHHPDGTPWRGPTKTALLDWKIARATQKHGGHLTGCMNWPGPDSQTLPGKTYENGRSGAGCTCTPHFKRTEELYMRMSILCGCKSLGSIADGSI